ncbi:MAG TPA: hypothetical protein VMW01_16435 [Williamwhitmania sp.]|nr:hypothetical protein [Williamwhitmania sp.]
MKTKIEIGTKVNGSKGLGIISSIITKSTGYVEVTYNSGIVKKEMAYNLTDENGIELKSKPANQKTSAEKLHEKLSITSNTPASWMNADGTKNYEAYNDFLEERERAARNSKSF